MPTMTDEEYVQTIRDETEEPDGEEEAADLEPEEGTGDEEGDEEEPEARAETEPEPQPEPEPDAAGLPALGETELGKAERAITAQRKKLAGILGDGYVAHDCPLCAALGFLSELPPEGTTLLAVADGNSVAFVAQTPEPEPAYEQAPDKRACDWCGAYGFVLTGSRNEHARVAPCSKCNGNGWVSVPVADGPPAQPAVPGDVVAAPGPPDGTGIGPDAWGRPAGHQHWGVPPSSIGV